MLVVLHEYSCVCGKVGGWLHGRAGWLAASVAADRHHRGPALQGGGSVTGGEEDGAGDERLRHCIRDLGFII